MFLTNCLQHKFSKKLRRSIITGYSQFMSGAENGADPSYVGNDDVNTFYGDVIVAYPVPVVGNGIAQALVHLNITPSNHSLKNPLVQRYNQNSVGVLAATGVKGLTLLMLRFLSSKLQGRKYFRKPLKPCHVGIHWKALTEYLHMSTHLPGFRSFLRVFWIILYWPN